MKVQHPGLVVTLGKDIGREELNLLCSKVFKVVVKAVPNCGSGVWIKDAPWLDALGKQKN